MPTPFQDRREAGCRLAEKLSAYASVPDAIVLGLARGGIPVAAEVAAGATMRVAAAAIKQMKARGVVLAAPVIACNTCQRMRATGWEVICVLEPVAFVSVGHWYRDFAQVTDDQVRQILAKSRDRTVAAN